MRSSAENDRDRYINRLFGVQGSDLLSVRDTAPSRLKLAQISIAEGRLLQLLISASAVKTVVEVGTCVGFSALCMAEVLPQDGHVYTVERNLENAMTAEKNVIRCKLDNKISIIRGDAKEQLKNLESLAPFDMMFIDADKSSYCIYLDWAKKNIRKGGLIVADNALLFGTVFEEDPGGKVEKRMHEAMIAFNQELADGEKYLSSMLPTDEGLLVGIKRT